MICDEELLQNDISQGLTSDEIIQKYIGRIASNLLDQTNQFTCLLAAKLALPTSQHTVLTEVMYASFRSTVLGLSLKMFPNPTSVEFNSSIVQMLEHIFSRMISLSEGYTSDEILTMNKYLQQEEQINKEVRRSKN